MSTELKQLKETIHEKGFNLFGVTDIKTYDAQVKKENRISEYFPAVKSIMVFGSGGRYFWEKMQTFMETPDGHFLKSTADPIDDYTVYISEKLKNIFPGLITEVIYPFSSDRLLADFTTLAVNAGFGVISPYLNLVLHPEFGSWISLRGAFLSTLELPVSEKPAYRHPCTGCTKPCLTACPVNAVSETEFNFKTCFVHRNPETDCTAFCYVRKACVVGPEHIYSVEEGKHRNKSSLSTLRQYFK